MSTQVEKLEHNMAKLTVEVSAEDFEKAMQKAFEKNRSKISIPGFRRGKVTRNIVERMYGPGVFYEDAANFALQDSYSGASEESGLEIMSRPEIDIVQIEKGKPFIYTAKVGVRPEVKLGQVRGLEVPKAEITVTDEDVEKALNDEAEKNSRLVDVDDRAAEMGDTVRLDFDGSVDGVPFEGGKGEDYELVLGSHSFIPGFEEQLAGKNAGEDISVSVTFPEDYHAEELKGKDAVFACRIRKISKKEVPALDDEFAKDVSEFDTLEEYKEDLRKNLLADKEKKARTEKENAAVDKLVEGIEVDIPQPVIDFEVERIDEDMSNRLMQQGINRDLYLKYTGMTEESYRKMMEPQAIRQLKTRLALEEVVKAENIEVTDEKFEEELKKMAESYHMELDKVREMMDDESAKQMKLDLAVQEAITLITDAAVEVEKTEEAAEEAKEEA